MGVGRRRALDGRKGSAAIAWALAGGGAVEDGAGWRCCGELDERAATCEEFFLEHIRTRVMERMPVACHYRSTIRSGSRQVCCLVALKWRRRECVANMSRSSH